MSEYDRTLIELGIGSVGSCDKELTKTDTLDTLRKQNMKMYLKNKRLREALEEIAMELEGRRGRLYNIAKAALEEVGDE